MRSDALLYSRSVSTVMPDRIPLIEPVVGEAELENVKAVLDSGYMTQGPYAEQFEERFADRADARHGITVTSCTTGMELALEALDVGSGDEVILPDFTHPATGNVVERVGADPVLVDVDRETYNIDPNAIREAVTDHTAALLPVAWGGQPLDPEPLYEIADEHGLAIVEDAACGAGASYDGDPVGSQFDASAFSFHPRKVLTTGEGGMITTDRDDVAERARRYINHGRTGKYEHAEVGHNYRMTNIAAAIGREQLRKLPDYISARRTNAAKLTAGLRDTPVVTPTTPAGRDHAYHQYTIRAPDRDDLNAYLEENGVGASVYYPRCIHTQPAYDGVTCQARHAEVAAKTVLSLPVHPALAESDIDHIIEVIQNYA